jgi:hypothetical protein
MSEERVHAEHAAPPSTESDKDCVRRVAALTGLERERELTREAKARGIRVTALRKAVEDEHRAQLAGHTALDCLFPPTCPWPEAINLAGVLDEIADRVRAHVVMAKLDGATTALWLAASWVPGAAEYAPVLLIVSPEKRCGKTTLLSLLRRLARHPLPTSNLSVAALFRTIDAVHPTLLIDEADAFFTPEKEELRGAINAGHTRDMDVFLRVEGDTHDVRAFHVFGFKVVALIGSAPDTITDRAIVIALNRKPAGTNVAKLRDADSNLFPRLQRQLARFAEDHEAALTAARPSIPDALDDRAADNWTLMLAIADLAGGHWPETARKAAKQLSGDRAQVGSSGVELLADIHAVLNARNWPDYISSHELVAQLVSDEDAPWATCSKKEGPLTQNSLARRLHKYRIRPGREREGPRRNRRGYDVADFLPAFRSYLPHLECPPPDGFPSGTVEPGSDDCPAGVPDLFVVPEQRDATRAAVPTRSGTPPTHGTPPPSHGNDCSIVPVGVEDIDLRRADALIAEYDISGEVELFDLVDAAEREAVPLAAIWPALSRRGLRDSGDGVYRRTLDQPS